MMDLGVANVMPCTYPSTKLYLVMHCWVHLTLGRNLVFSRCCQKSPFPCSLLGPAPTFVYAPEKTSEAEGDDGIYAPEPDPREYYSEQKTDKSEFKQVVLEILSRTNI